MNSEKIGNFRMVYTETMQQARDDTLTFRFYEELNDHLKPAFRKKEISLDYHVGQTVKDAIEKLGIPHGEVDLILANGQSVGFSYRLQKGDRISVYPVFESFDISPLIHLRPEPLRRVRFILDAHLGKLARMLRLLGFDTLYRNDYRDEELIRLALEEKRIILTRDRGLLMRREVTHGYFLRNIHPFKQLKETVIRFQLKNHMKPFARCAVCNGIILPAEKETVLDKLPENTARYYNKFFICSSCGKVYWKGSHYERLKKRMEELE
jgi:uncharacterized protein